MRKQPEISDIVRTVTILYIKDWSASKNPIEAFKFIYKNGEDNNIPKKINSLLER